MKRTYLRRNGSRPPGRPRKARPDQAESIAIRPTGHRAPTGAAPRRDRDGDRIDESLVLTHDQEEALIEGLSEEAADIAWWFLQHFWNWSRQDQVTLRAFAEAAAKMKRLEHAPRRTVRRELDEARQMLQLLADRLELSAADILAATNRSPEWTTTAD